jgi:hypothetical protein
LAPADYKALGQCREPYCPEQADTARLALRRQICYNITRFSSPRLPDVASVHDARKMEQEPVVEFGFSLPSRGPTASMGNLRTLVQHADAHTASAIRRAVHLGDGWLGDGWLGDGWHPIGLRPPANLNPDEMSKAVAQLHDEAAKVGRNPQDITISFRGPIDISDAGGADRKPLSGGVAAIQDDIARYTACGVSHMVFDVMAPEVAEVQRAMDRVAQEVKPGVNA